MLYLSYFLALILAIVGLFALVGLIISILYLFEPYRAKSIARKWCEREGYRFVNIVIFKNHYRLIYEKSDVLTKNKVEVDLLNGNLKIID